MMNNVYFIIAVILSSIVVISLLTIAILSIIAYNDFRKSCCKSCKCRSKKSCDGRKLIIHNRGCCDFKMPKGGK